MTSSISWAVKRGQEIFLAVIEASIWGPWSHGLLPDLVWGAVLGSLVWLLRRERRVALLAGLAVVSHFLLDGLVHVKARPSPAPEPMSLGLVSGRTCRWSRRSKPP